MEPSPRISVLPFQAGSALVLAVEDLGVLLAEAVGVVWSGRVRTRNAATTEATTRKAVRVRTTHESNRNNHIPISKEHGDLEGLVTLRASPSR